VIRTRLRARRRRPELPELQGIKTQQERHRERLARLAEIRNRWWAEGKRTCCLCGKLIRFRSEYTLDHREPGKMSGCKDHSLENLGPAHFICNVEKGSRRIG
jgi:hypothetical protein